MRLSKADEADRTEEIEAIVDGLDLRLSPAETEELVSSLAEAAADSSTEVISQAALDPQIGMTVQVGVGNTGRDLFGQFNLRARTWASDNVAQLVSQVSDTTRDRIRQVIVDGFDQKLSRTEIAEAIEAATAFSPERSSLIAATEVANANSQGALNGLFGMRDMGLTVKKYWVLGPLPCMVCIANAAEGEIELEAPFFSGDFAPLAHPNCRCALGSTASIPAH